MFDKEKFGTIIKKINDAYPTQYDFADKSSVNRTYLSQYINLKLDVPPKPKILERIAKASKGITNYNELMEICGYVSNKELQGVKNSLLSSSKSNFFVVPILISKDGKLYETEQDIMLPYNIDLRKQYFGFRINDDSMLPLVGTGDIAIIEKTDKFDNGNTCFISIDTNILLIRKIIDFKDYIELHTAIPYSQPIKLTNDEIKQRNFKILGKVIRVENSSAFK